MNSENKTSPIAITALIFSIIYFLGMLSLFFRVFSILSTVSLFLIGPLASLMVIFGWINLHGQKGKGLLILSIIFIAIGLALMSYGLGP